VMKQVHPRLAITKAINTRQVPLLVGMGNSGSRNPVKGNSGSRNPVKGNSGSRNPVKGNRQQEPGEGQQRQQEPGEGQQQQEPGEGEVPESYTLTFEEGVQVDQSMVEAATPVFKELGLSQDAAQKLASFYYEQQKAQAEKGWNDFTKMVEQREEKWLTEIQTDPDFGGPKFDASRLRVGKLLDKFDTGKEMEKFLIEEGYSGAAPIFKVLARISQHFDDDDLDLGQGDQGGVDKDVPDYVKMGWKTVDEYQQSATKK
jgi:hypothetical protein